MHRHPPTSETRPPPDATLSTHISTPYPHRIRARSRSCHAMLTTSCCSLRATASGTFLAMPMRPASLRGASPRRAHAACRAGPRCVCRRQCWPRRRSTEARATT
eukprot:354917-Chlamydomonas_euryale.AAC.21